MEPVPGLSGKTVLEVGEKKRLPLGPGERLEPARWSSESVEPGPTA